METKIVQVWYVQYVGAVTGRPMTRTCYTYKQAKDFARRASRSHDRGVTMRGLPTNIIGPFDHTVLTSWTLQ